MGLGSGRRCGLRLAAAICGLRRFRVRPSGVRRPWCAAPGRGRPPANSAGRRTAPPAASHWPRTNRAWAAAPWSARHQDWTRGGIGRSSMRPPEHARAVSCALCHRAAAGIRAIRIPSAGVPRGTWPTPVLGSRGRCVGLGSM